MNDASSPYSASSSSESEEEEELPGFERVHQLLQAEQMREAAKLCEQLSDDERNELEEEYPSDAKTINNYIKNRGKRKRLGKKKVITENDQTDDEGPSKRQRVAPPPRREVELEPDDRPYILPPVEEPEFVYQPGVVEIDSDEEEDNEIILSDLQDMLRRFNPQANKRSVIENYAAAFGFDDADDITLYPDDEDVGTSIYARFMDALVEIRRIERRLQLGGLIDAQNVEADDSNYARSIRKILQGMMQGKNMLVSFVKTRINNDPGTDPIGEKSLKGISGEMAIFQPARKSTEFTRAFQKLLSHVLEAAEERDFFRYRDWCYQRVTTSDQRWPTLAYRPVMEIRDFVYEVCNNAVHDSAWAALASAPSYPEGAAKWLENCKDSRFPQLKKQRLVWAFRNGTYDARTNTFYEYGRNAPPTGTVASKYFDAFFAPEWVDCDIDLIPTPNFEKILKDQKLSKEVIDFVFVNIGRFLFPVGKHDSWQVMLFFKGAANTGKSTLLKALKNLWNRQDVGILESNMEKTFGLESLYQCFALLCWEVKKDFQLSQAQFQTMLDGGAIQIPRKHKVAQQCPRWKAGLMFAGNELFGYHDNSGSIARRVLIVDFQHEPSKMDGEMDNKLKAELPALIVKCRRMYFDYVDKYGTQSLWVKRRVEGEPEPVYGLPEYFREQRNKLERNTNPLVDFIANSDDLRLDYESDGYRTFMRKNKEVTERLYMPLANFKRLLGEWTQNNNLVSKPWNPDYYTQPFKKFNLNITTKAQRREWPLGKGVKKHCYFVEGITTWEDVWDRNDGKVPNKAHKKVAAEPEVSEFDKQQ